MEPNAPWVVFDLDECLCGLRHHLQTALYDLTGIDLHWSRWDRYDLTGLYGISLEDFTETLLSYRIIERAILEPGAWAALHSARLLGYRTAILTARGWHPEGERVTRDWLETHGLRPDRLHLVPMHQAKGEVLPEYGRVAWFLDDHLGHAAGAEASGVVDRVLLQDRPWNRVAEHPGQRIHSLWEVPALLAASPAVNPEEVLPEPAL